MHNLTLGDATQTRIGQFLKVTERLLAAAATKASGRHQDAEIWTLPDLGLPNNVTRIYGGFFTGALYQWRSDTPIVPIDTTVNSCAISVFKLMRPFASRQDFVTRIQRAIERTEEHTSYAWNFDSGNHFVTYGRVSGSKDVLDGHYLVLHSSASEYKKQDNGLYPVPGNWFMHGVKAVQMPDSTRFLRYIDGTLAERFYKVASFVEHTNQFRHQFFAEIIADPQNIESEIFHRPHYGMPASDAVAIGCQWMFTPSLFLLLTGPSKPLYFIQTTASERNNVALSSGNAQLYPHGLGKASIPRLNLSYERDALSVNGTRYPLDGSLEDNKSLMLRDIGDEPDAVPPIVNNILHSCPGNVVGQLQPLYSYSNAGFTDAEHSEYEQEA